jgi:SAM-dependent methyltransferase
MGRPRTTLRRAAARVLSRRLPPTDPAALVQRSIKRYRRMHRRYESVHPDIFNPREHARLRKSLADASTEMAAGAGDPPRALDLGCGSGNVTGHLLALGLDVVAADVSPEFLADVRRRFGATDRLQTMQVNGLDLNQVPTGSFDMACAYAVLHHIPDYLAAVDELCRVVRPGGVVYIDHEANDSFYDKGGCFWDLLREVEQRRPRRSRFLLPRTYLDALKRVVNPAHPWDIEGDIHVWEWDRIEWPQVEARLVDGGCEIVRGVDYLNYSGDWPEDIWERYEGRCTNMRLVIARRLRAP